MTPTLARARTLLALILAALAFPCLAADYPAPQEGTWVVRDFRFHSGEVLPELKLRYRTIGAPTGEPVLVMHGTGAFAAAASLAAVAADPRSDAPEDRVVPAVASPVPPTYDVALASWHGAEDINGWIGARFTYDAARAMQLSETQRASSRLAIHRPEAFYREPTGVCVDLARFGVETLRAIDATSKPVYLMIEFAPLEVAGNVLRRHWLAGFERDGAYWYFADAKRPGHLAGPYPSAASFVDEYAHYRGRTVVAFSERASYERTMRAKAVKETR